MKKIILLSGFLFLATSISFSQEMVVIEGIQKPGADPKSSEMLSDPVTITTEMRIVKVEGDFGSFWLTGSTESGINVTHQYLDKNSPVATVLEAGVYFAFPNLKPGSKTARVTIYLEPK